MTASRKAVVSVTVGLLGLGLTAAFFAVLNVERGTATFHGRAPADAALMIPLVAVAGVIAIGFARGARGVSSEASVARLASLGFAIGCVALVLAVYLLWYALVLPGYPARL